MASWIHYSFVNIPIFWLSSLPPSAVVGSLGLGTPANIKYPTIVQYSTEDILSSLEYEGLKGLRVCNKYGRLIDSPFSIFL